MRERGIVALVFMGIVGLVGCVGDSPSPGGGTDAGADASGDAADASPGDADAAPAPTVVAIFSGGGYGGASNSTLGNGARSCAIVAPTGSVWCWGDNQFGELGIGTSGADALVPTRITQDIGNAPFDAVDDLALGAWHTCARKKNGKVYCWGQDRSGAIGDNAVDPSNTRPPVTLPQPLALGSFVAMQGPPALAAGYGHTCAIDATGKVNCWGWNIASQLGHDSTNDSPCSWMYATSTTKCNGGPVAVMDNTPFANAGIAQVVAGETFSCVRTGGGNLYCYGDRSWFGSPAGPNPAPAELMTDQALTQPLKNVSKIAMTAKSVCALTSAQNVYCAGFNAFGQTGVSTSSVAYAQPVGSPALTGVKDIAAGDAFTCAVKVDGSVWCWGLNDQGQLGNGVSDAGVSMNANPIQVVGQNGQGTLTGVASVAAGFAQACALKTDGSVWCWGQNNHGQLGDGTAISRATPAPVPGLP